jgi:hypothetical protein
MVPTTEIWKQTLHKILEDSEITQTIYIVEDDASAFRVVQLYALKRFRAGRKNGTLAPRATYCRDSMCETREMAVQEARRLVAKHLTDNWLIHRDEQSAYEAAAVDEEANEFDA